MNELGHPLKTAKRVSFAAKKPLFDALIQSYFKKRNQSKTIDAP